MAKQSTNPRVAEINANFLIRWRNQDEKKSHLIGAGRYHTLVGQSLKEKHFNKVLSTQEQDLTFKIRGRLEIKFISK